MKRGGRNKSKAIKLKAIEQETKTTSLLESSDPLLLTLERAGQPDMVVEDNIIEEELRLADMPSVSKQVRQLLVFCMKEF